MKIIILTIVVVLVGGIIGIVAGAVYYRGGDTTVQVPEGTMCTMDAMECPNGAVVGRSGPNCEFVCPTGEMSELPEVPADVKAQIDAKGDLITLTEPHPLEVVVNPLEIRGLARGNWYFEGSFPVILVNWDGLIIAEGVAKADGEWMTTDFVPYKAKLDFVSPVKADTPDFMVNGTLILKKDNPSGLPENDDTLEIPIRFAPEGTVREPQGV